MCTHTQTRLGYACMLHVYACIRTVFFQTPLYKISTLIGHNFSAVFPLYTHYPVVCGKTAKGIRAVVHACLHLCVICTLCVYRAKYYYVDNRKSFNTKFVCVCMCRVIRARKDKRAILVRRISTYTPQSR